MFFGKFSASLAKISLPTAAFLLIMNQSVSYAQSVTIQANPVFSTPPPSSQNLGPKSKPFDGPAVEYSTTSSQSGVDSSDTTPTDSVDDGSGGTSLGAVTLDKAYAKVATPTIGSVSFEGNKYTRDFVIKNVLDPIGDKQGEVLDQAWLNKEVGRINKQQKFKLKGYVTQNESNPNEADIHFDVYERQPWQLSLTADNQGRPGAGMYRWGTIVSNENLLGIGDKLTLSYVGSSRSTRAGAVYDLPLNTRGGKFQAKYFYHRINYDKQYTPGNDKILGQDNVLVLTLEQPLDKKRIYTPFISTLFRQVTLDRHFSPGVGKRRIVAADPRPIAVGLKYKRPDKLGLTKMKIAGIVGQRWFGGDSQFFRLNVNAKRTFKLPKKNMLVMRGQYQYSPDAMPPVQQIGIAGAYQVRGYTEGLIYGDRGYQFSLEHHWPIPFLSKVDPAVASRFKGVTFFDMGQAWQDKSSGRFTSGVTNDSNRTLLMAVGGGIRYKINRFAQGFCDVAWGLGRRNELELGGSPSVRVHFGVRSNLLPKKYAKHDGDRVDI